MQLATRPLRVGAIALALWLGPTSCQSEADEVVRRSGLVMSRQANGFLLNDGNEFVPVQWKSDPQIGWWIGDLGQVDLESHRLSVSLLMRVDPATREAVMRAGLSLRRDPVSKWASLFSPELRTTLAGLDPDELDIGSLGILHAVHPMPETVVARVEVPGRQGLPPVIDGGRVAFFTQEALARAGSPSEHELECMAAPILEGKREKFRCSTPRSRHRVQAGRSFQAVFFGLASPEDVVPRVTKAAVIGKLWKGVLIADQVVLRHARPPLVSDDSALPRYLMLGDSMAAGYRGEVQRLLAGRVDLRHPAGNCYGTVYATARVDDWLGRWQLPEESWDVISFNFGQWDVDLPKDAYQKNLSGIIEQLRQTGARLVWVTTTPVPGGFEDVAVVEAGGTPGRRHGAMRQYLNPWALEVMRRHPEIEIVDAGTLVATNPYYADWRALSQDIHLHGDPSRPLGDLVARGVLGVLGESAEMPPPLDFEALRPWKPAGSSRERATGVDD